MNYILHKLSYSLYTQRQINDGCQFLIEYTFYLRHPIIMFIPHSYIVFRFKAPDTVGEKELSITGLYMGMKNKLLCGICLA